MWSKTDFRKQACRKFKGTREFPLRCLSHQGLQGETRLVDCHLGFNNEVEGIDDSRMLPYDLPMPDYRRLSNG